MRAFIFFIISINCLINAQICSGVIAKDSLGSQDVKVDCSYPLSDSNTCFSLKLSYPKLYSTNTYKTESIAYKPPVPYNYGTALNVVADDLFVKAVNLPFSFCFFGKNYDNVAISTNGLISFDMANMKGDAISFPNIKAPNPSYLLPTNSIFGVMQDLVFPENDESEIYYSIEGAAPCRRLIVNFYRGIIAGCQDRSSSQIILYEGSNEIEIYVDQKPKPCSSIKNENALIGIQNEDGTLGYSPSNRNTGVWQTEKEAWKFSPTGAEIIPTIQWYNSKKELVATGANVSVCPSDNEVYTAEATYNVCGNSNYVLRDDIRVTFDLSFPLTKNSKHMLCSNNNSILVNLDDDVYKQSLVKQDYQSFKFDFFLTLDDARNNLNSQPSKNVTIVGSKKYFVRVSNPSSPSCYRIAELAFDSVSNALKKNWVDICDVQADGVENNYQLSQLNPQLFDFHAGFNIKYFLNQNDAQNNTNSIATARLTSTTELWIRTETQGCYKVFGPIKIVFTLGPTVITPVDFSIYTCDFTDNDQALSEFYKSLANLVVANPKDPNLLIRFYDSLVAANNGGAGEIRTFKDGMQTIYVRVEFLGGCYSIAIINLNINFKPFKANNKKHYICFDGTQDVRVDLDELSKDMLVLPLTGVVKSYYTNKKDAVDGARSKEINPIQIITEDGNYPSVTYYVRFQEEEGCFVVRNITITLVHPTLFRNYFEMCDVDNDSREFVDLVKLSAAILGGQNAAVSYFTTEAEAWSNQNPLTTTEVNNSKVIFVRIVAYGCVQVYPIKISLTYTPDAVKNYQVVENNVCDNNNNGIEPFDITKYERHYVADPSLYTFEYYKDYNPANHTFSGLIANPKAFPSTSKEVIYVKTVFKSSNCFSVTRLDLKINFVGAPILKPATLEICDYQFDFFETFVLSDALPMVFNASDNNALISNFEISYYANEADANLGDPTKSVGVRQVTKFASVFFWVRFQNKLSGCYTVAPIELKTYFPPKAIISKIKICDNNLDGIMDVNLMAYKNQMVVVQSDQNKFSFYWSFSDANKGVNRIQNPENFSASPFPSRLWVRIENLGNCKDINYIDFENNQSLALHSAGPFVINDVCDAGNDGKEIIDLTQFQRQIFNDPQAIFTYYPTLADLQQNTNIITSPRAFSYDESVHKTNIVAMVSKKGLCPQMVTISIRLKKTPMFTLPDYYFCPGVGIEIKPDWTGLDIKTFEWKNPKGEIISNKDYIENIKVEGVYQIKVTANNGCTFTTNFNVKAYEVPIITQIIPDGNNYTVIATGSKKILYSKDGVNWQESNFFGNLPEGVVTFYVKFLERDCLGDQKRGLIVKIINTFSPNADGVNDVWTFDNLDVFEGKLADIKIYDRNGLKVFEQSSATQLIWPGQHNGRSLNTANYWYILTLPDGRIFKGWILLKNRN